MFDPFLYVPLPIPPSKTTYEVTFFSRDSSTGMCANSTIYSVALSYRATVGDLVNIVSNRANISPKLVIKFLFVAVITAATTVIKFTFILTTNLC